MIATGVALVMGALVLHLRGTYFAVLTFGMTELIRHAITYWEDVAPVVQAAADRGEDVYAADGGHWNERGHELVAQRLATHLRATLPLGRPQN